MPETSSAIFCRDLRKRYPAKPEPVDAVRGLDLEVHRGECFGLLGPNGAGKTTTIEILEGLLAATSGEVLLLGRHGARTTACSGRSSGSRCRKRACPKS